MRDSAIHCHSRRDRAGFSYLANLLYVVDTPPWREQPPSVPKNDARHKIPLLSLHLGLVQAYWSTQELWKPWAFLEDDFSVLRQHGFCFSRSSMVEYTQVVESAASQFADSVEQIANGLRAGAIVVYGRGHWTMNAAAFVAAKLGLPLYVVERGMLPSSYIVDESVPFTAPGSRFRSLWDRFRGVEDWDRKNLIRLTESRWHLYSTLLTKKEESKDIVHKRSSRVLVGQCLFDYNCIGAPFSSAVEFVEYVLGEKPEVLDKDLLVYRHHPLSPEEYPNGTIDTQYGPIRVDLSESLGHIADGARSLHLEQHVRVGGYSGLWFDSQHP